MFIPSDSNENRSVSVCNITILKERRYKRLTAGCCLLDYTRNGDILEELNVGQNIQRWLNDVCQKDG